MLRFTNRIEALLLLANYAADERRCSELASAGSRRACGSHHGSGPVRGIFRSACGAFRSACGPCASTAFYATDCRASRTGAPWSKTPDRRTVYCCTDRRIGSRRISTAWRKRQFTFVHPARGHGWGAANPAGRPGLTSRIIVRRVPDGAEIAGRTQIDNHAAIIRGPFLRNPAFAQPSGGNGAALRLGRTTFRGRFADQPRRLQHRTAVIGWIGPEFAQRVAINQPYRT
jgi:hypothetical protein